MSGYARLWKIVQVLLIGGLCLGLYYNGLSNDFTFDDHLAIVNNKDTEWDSTNLIDLWRHDCWGKDLTKHDSHRSYRPLLIVIFRLIRWASSGLNPKIFRIVSIGSHTAASILVYIVAHLLIGHQDLALASGLLFASHPVVRTILPFSSDH